MAQQIINIGTTPNDGLGDSIRTAFGKTNDNFSDLYSFFQTSPPPYAGFVPQFDEQNTLWLQWSHVFQHIRVRLKRSKKGGKNWVQSNCLH
jgi:hypothetical protein